MKTWRTICAALSAFDVATVQYRGWSGLKNGELLHAAESAGFTVFITGDKTLEYEQNLSGRKIAIISLSAPHWPLVKDHVVEIAEAVRKAQPGSLTRIDCGRFVRMRVPLPSPS
jgi:hypothetical protein